MYVSDAGQLNFPTAGIFSLHCSCFVGDRQGAFTVLIKQPSPFFCATGALTKLIIAIKGLPLLLTYTTASHLIYQQVAAQQPDYVFFFEIITLRGLVDDCSSMD